MDDKPPKPSLQYFVGKLKESAEEEAKEDAILASLPPEQRNVYMQGLLLKQHTQIQELFGMFSHPEFPGKKKDDARKPKAVKSSRRVTKDEESNAEPAKTKKNKK
ncbi:MAG: hypothetical protein SFW07_01720 [Gammaproteobacteria bacterium]|nr:hypothetical protein [Gammaproteobacteria bacterium]